MALQIFDRIKERVQTGAGTGNLTLLGAPTGFKTFSSRLSVSDTTYYCIEGPNGAFEIGVGTLSSSTTLVRTTVLRSSNSDGAISIGASGQYFVFISYIADKAVYRNIANEVVVPSEGFRFSDNTTQITSPTAAIALKADIASPTFTGTPSGPTATVGSNTTQLATTAFVSSAIAAVDLSVYALLPDILPVAGTLLSYGGSRQLAAGGTVTHSGALTLGGALTLPGNPSSALHAAPKQYVDSAVGAVDLSGRVPYTGATGAVNLGSNALTCGAITASGSITSSSDIIIGTASSSARRYFLAQNENSSAYFAVGKEGSSGSQILPGTSSYAGVVGTYGTTAPLQFVVNGALLLSMTAHLVQQRSGLNAQCYLLNKSYTSDATQEAMMLDAGKQISGKLGLYSYRGSSGGSNYPIQIGMLATDGTTFSGLSVETNGAITASGAVKIGTTYQWLGDSNGIFMQTPSVANHFAVRSDGTELSSTGRYGHNSGAVNSGTIDIAWGRDSAGVGAVYTTAAGSTLAGFKCGAITASGNISSPGTIVATSAVLSSAYYSIGYDNFWTKGGTGASSTFDICTQTTARIRNYANSADAGLSCGAITASGDITVNKVGGSSLAALWLAPATNYSSSVYFGGNSGDYSNRITRDGNSFDLSVIAYGSLSHITTTGSILLQSGTHIVQQRNGLNPQTDQLFSTYTSATSFACLDQRANAGGTAYEISSFKGSAGGSNLPINIGHRDSAGTFTSALSVATSGVLTMTNAIIGDGYGIRQTGGAGIFSESSYTWNSSQMLGFPAKTCIQSPVNGNLALQNWAGTDFGLLQLGGTTSSFPAIKRNAAAINLRLADDSADAALTCGAITASGNVGIGGTPYASSSLHIQSSFARAILLNNSTIGTGATDGAYFGCTTTGQFTIYNQESASPAYTYIGQAGVLPIYFATNDITRLTIAGDGAITASGNLTLSDTNLITGTTTGTIIATVNSQKLGFWGATPIVQPTTAVAAATLVSNGGTTLTDTDLFDGYTLKQIVKALRIAGLLA